jgi:thiol:disulfide interchange protein DsbD
LLNLYRLPHDTPSDHLSVPRLMTSLFFLGLSFYLMPALFKFNTGGDNQRPNGVVYDWVDSFLLPEAREGKGELAWTGNLKQAVDDARAYRLKTGQPKFVFIDFTGETCTNCKINEHVVFSKTDVQKLFQPYERVRLYTDKVPNDLYPPRVRDTLGSDVSRQRGDATANLWFQKKAFNTEQLPLYVILEPLPDNTIAIRGIYREGKINDENAFVQFLKEPLENAAGDQRAQVVGR